MLDQAEYGKTIAPEFIGKVFETLLACIDAESQASRRKVTGSFYTPREIVDYMVNEALDAFLEATGGSRSGWRKETADGKPHLTDSGLRLRLLLPAALLLHCKILDPACGISISTRLVRKTFRKIDVEKR